VTTLGQHIDKLLNEVLIGTYRAHFNTLNGSINASVTDLVVTYGIEGIGEGSYLAIDSELMYVVPGGVDTNSKTLTVVRGVRGTTAATHSSGASVEINPRYPRVTILSAMLDEARAWPDGLYRVSTHEVSLSSNETAIDIGAAVSATDIRHVVGVHRQKFGTDSGRWIREAGWRFERDITAIGDAFVFVENSQPSTATYQVLVARPFDLTAFTEATALSTLGMAESMAEILRYGAAWRLINGREARRLLTEVESEGRTAEEVPVQSNVTFARQLKQIRDARLGEEINRLRHIYGQRVR
jgi:hypothetical protein